MESAGSPGSSGNNCGNCGRRRIALLLQYDGTAYNGWQLQGKGRTVQGEIEQAAAVLTGETVRITASGRTDSGVHALGQVAHFDTRSVLPLDRICTGLNGIMQTDVSVLNAYETGGDFHARFSAVEREYQYIIYNHPLRSPFMRYRAMWFTRGLDDSYIADVLRLLEGEHDFASFCKKKSRLENTVRSVLQTGVTRQGDYIYINIRGNAFLHHMIRIIIGTCIEMFIAGARPDYINVILDKKDRNCSGKTAPPHGLYLKEIKFSPELAVFPCAFA